MSDAERCDHRDHSVTLVIVEVAPPTTEGGPRRVKLRDPPSVICAQRGESFTWRIETAWRSALGGEDVVIAGFRLREWTEPPKATHPHSPFIRGYQIGRRFDSQTQSLVLDFDESQWADYAGATFSYDLLFTAAQPSLRSTQGPWLADWDPSMHIEPGERPPAWKRLLKRLWRLLERLWR